MTISILIGVMPEDIADGFDQEPAELAAMLLHLGSSHARDEDRADFLKHFGEAVLASDPEAQTHIHSLLADMAMAVEGQF